MKKITKEVKKKVKYKIWLLCLALILSGFSFEYPVFIEYLNQKSVSSIQIASILSIQSLGVFVFEYITGVWADRYGYRRILLLGAALMVVAESIFLFCNNYLLFVIGILLISISVSSKSGADVAYLHDFLEQENKLESFDKILCNMSSIQVICQIGVLLVGSWICKFSMKLPFALTILFLSITFIILLLMPNSKKTGESSAKKIIISGLVMLKNHRLLFLISIIAAIVFPVYHIISYYSQVYMGNVGIPIEYFGFFYIIISGAQSIGTKYTEALLKKLSGLKLMIISSLTIGLSLALFLFNNICLAVVGVLLIGTAFGVLYMSNTIEINKIATSQNRATLISQQHAITKISQTLVLFVAGSSLKLFTVGQMFFGVGILVLYSMIGLLIFSRKLNDIKNMKN